MDASVGVSAVGSQNSAQQAPQWGSSCSGRARVIRVSGSAAPKVTREDLYLFHAGMNRRCDVVVGDVHTLRVRHLLLPLLPPILKPGLNAWRRQADLRRELRPKLLRKGTGRTYSGREHAVRAHRARSSSHAPATASDWSQRQSPGLPPARR
eukprot:7391721-Prymnesium_polylepis.1